MIMEKKGLGRGLEDISKSFLSDDGATTNKNPPEEFSAPIKRADTCSSCRNLIQGPDAELRCRIFTLESEKYNVPHLNTITLNYATFCEHFQSNANTVNQTVDSTQTMTGNDQFEATCEVYESVDIRRKLAFARTPSVQEEIRRTLFKYIGDNFEIERINLRKVVDTSNHTQNNRKSEEILICIKEA